MTTAPVADTALREARRLYCRLSAPRAAADPYGWYERLRGLGPVLPLETAAGTGAVLVTTFAQCSAILRDRRFTAITPQYRDIHQPGWREHVFTRCMYRSMLFDDGTPHACARGLVNRYFTARAVADLRSTLPSIVDGLLADVAALGPVVDLQRYLADPYAAIVTGRLLGIADTDAVALGRLLRHVEPVLELNVAPAQQARMLAAGTEVCDRLRYLIRRRRRYPRPDVLSALARHHGTGEDAVSAVLLLLGAGFDSPASMVGLGIRLLLDHPAQADALRAEPRLATGATDEILRHEPPVHVIARLNTEPVVTPSGPVAPGTLFLLLVAAANRDPTVVTDGDRFDVRRGTVSSLSLGAGPHYCLGGAVARLSGEVLFPLVLQRFPGLAPAGPAVLRDPATMLRGLVSLPVSLG